MDLKQLQRENKIWCQHNFPNAEPWMPLMGATEEIGELCHIHLKEAQGIRKVDNVKELKMDAVGDIIVFLADYCNRSGLDLEQSVFFAWSTASQRDWKKFPKNGVNE